LEISEMSESGAEVVCSHEIIKQFLIDLTVILFFDSLKLVVHALLLNFIKLT